MAEMKQNNEFWDDLSLGVLSRVRISCYTVMLSLFLILVLDYRAVEHSKLLITFLCRLLPFSIAILVLLFSFINTAIIEKYYQNLINVLLISIALSSTLIATWAGGFRSEYHLGIVEIEFAYVTFIPISRHRAFFNVIGLNSLYIVCNLILDGFIPVPELLNVGVRLFIFALITLVAHHILHCYRVEDFKKRKFIEEKNYELVQQKEEISVHRDTMELLYQQMSQQAKEISKHSEEIEHQKLVLQAAFNEIHIKSNNILDSINYAKRIQDAVFPSCADVQQIFPQSFLLYLPKDIVSGDFCWIREMGTKIYVAVADCTGHGVPGAFMSVLGHSALIASVENNLNSTPACILNELRERIKTSLGQTGKYNETKDGMDLVLTIIDREERTASVSGAYNSLYIFRQNELIEIKGDRMPIGIYNKEEPFNCHKVPIETGDQFLLFSDGYYSQFGGPKNQKMKTHRFKEILQSAQSLPILQQAEYLENKLNEWKGGNHQVDDILILSFKI